MSRGKDKIRDKYTVGWKQALAEAEPQIALYKRKIHELNRSVRIMHEKIASDASWPRQVEGHKSEEQHSV